MMRLKILQREDMNAEQKKLCEEIEAVDGRVRGGPYWAYIHIPKFMRLHNEMSRYLRSCSLTGRERQIAVLAVVRHWDAKYPWAVQVRASLAEGRRAGDHRCDQCKTAPQARRPRRAGGV